MHTRMLFRERLHLVLRQAKIFSLGAMQVESRAELAQFPTRKYLFDGPLAALVATLFLILFTSCVNGASAQSPEIQLSDAQWIWSPAYAKDEVPEGTCFFRKSINIENPKPIELGVVYISADNQYELYVNGNRVGDGGDWRKMQTFDIAAHLRRGPNVIAVKAMNTDAGAAGLVARVLLQHNGSSAESHSTDKTWKTSVQEFRDWTHPRLRDSDWLAAKEYGPLGAVLPWGDEVVTAAEGARFQLNAEFGLSRVARDEQTGSLIAMTFAGDGRVLASVERGPLLSLEDKDGDGYFETKTVFSDQINSAQGILSLGSRVFAVGPGPQGGGLYRLEDTDGDHVADNTELLLPFRGSLGEHGPHAVRLGPDGLLYVMSGNHARVNAAPSPRSAYRNAYEGDLVKPRYEDPNGHAAGIPAPGGTLFRTDFNGSFVEEIAGGFRNAYDFAFNDEGQVITYDSDMEWDIGAPWYRPTRIIHAAAGGEFGWRSGWAKWPEYYLDSLPAALDMGPGSPTGVAFCSHPALPKRLQNTILAADWARGEIHTVRLERSGGSYQAKSEILLKGRPMAVTDLAMGPDGAIYFCTGGRGTEGGIYRIAWKGKVPPAALDFGKGIQRALRQPQLDTDWARAEISKVRRELGEEWGPELATAAADETLPISERRQAIRLMSLYGPRPSGDLVTALTRDKAPELRVEAARQLSRAIGPAAAELATGLLTDRDAGVRRAACEALLQQTSASLTDIVPMLADSDRHVRFAARRVLESREASSWWPMVAATTDPAIYLNGAVALLAAEPAPAVAATILHRCGQLLSSQPSGQQQIDLLRVVQLALLRGEIDPAATGTLGKQLAALYPTADARANQELVKLMVHLQEPSAAKLMVARLGSDASATEKLGVAAYAAHLRSGWQTPEKLALLRYYEELRAGGVAEVEGGYSISSYVEHFARNFFTNLTVNERRQILAVGERFPTSALSILAKLPDEVGEDVLQVVQQIDEKLAGQTDDRFARLRVGCVAVLAKSNHPAAIKYLHQQYTDHPQRRQPIAMALTQHPEAPNWQVLIDALDTLEGAAAEEVLAALQQVRVRPEEPLPYRNVILQGLRQSGAGAKAANQLLSYWVGEPQGVAGTQGEARMAAWQNWFASTFPNELPAKLPKSTVANRWSYGELLSHLSDPMQRGDASHGRKVFSDATCIKCHRHGREGERIGPDLSTLARRFQTKEVLESVVYPSHVISDQYASKAVISDGKTYTGMMATDGPDHIVVLTKEGRRVRIAKTDVEGVKEVATSSMPEGLLNNLSLSDVSDLFAYLMQEPGQGVAGRPKAAGR